MTTETLPCPECPTGRISIMPAQTEQTILPGYFIRDSSVLETRLRDCTIACCNACEFCHELTKDGLVPHQEN